MALRKKKDFTAAIKKRDENKQPIDSHGITPYLNRFQESAKINNISQDTLRRRYSAIKKFILWCGERELNQPQDITRPILERYKSYLYYYRKADGQPLSFSSQHVMLTPLKTFFKWLTRENYLLYNPASEMMLPKKAKKLPRYILSVEEVETIMQQPEITSPKGIRDRSILEVLYSTGMRRMEITNLSIYDIDVKRGAVWIREGKGMKDRFIPMGQKAIDWVEKYRLDIRPLLITDPNETRLFITDYGEPFKREFLSGIVRRYLDKADIKAIGSCHLFRHAMATHMLENGADIRFIQAMLGHEDLATTEIYTHVSIEKLKEVHTATHPAKGMKSNNDLTELLAELDNEDDEE